jgi:diacylglycerol kinase family enzyme
MRIALVHNPTAGDGQRADLEAVLALVRSHGHEIRYRSSKDTHLARFLAQRADLVAVAGGDGTIAKVVKLMRQRRTPIAPLPMGTANNICTALGLASLSLGEQISGWKTAARMRFDIGRIAGPWGLRRFVESFGIGVIPRMIIAAERKESTKRKHKNGRNGRAVRHAIRRLNECPPVDLDVSIDGRSSRGRFVLFEVMNIGLVGPNLNLATRADPSDGRFDVVVVPESERKMLRECLVAEKKGVPWPHELPTMQGSKLEIAAGRFAVHVDDEICFQEPGGRRNGADIEIAMREGVRLLVPAKA